MTEKLIMIALLGLTFIGCSNSKDCASQLKNKLRLSDLHSDSTELIMADCGELDSLDFIIFRSPTIIEIVNTPDLQEGKYDYARLVSDFDNFRKTKLYADLRTTFELKDKKFNSVDWVADSVNLVKLFELNPEDIRTLKSVISDPNNESMTFSEAFKEMNRIQIKNIGRMKNEE
jgi:hypothetical protein